MLQHIDHIQKTRSRTPSRLLRLGVATLIGISLAGCSSHQEKTVEACLAAQGQGDWSVDINQKKGTAEIFALFDDNTYQDYLVSIQNQAGQNQGKATDTVTYGHRESYTYFLPIMIGKVMTIMPETGYNYYADQTLPYQGMNPEAQAMTTLIHHCLSPAKAPVPPAGQPGASALHS